MIVSIDRQSNGKRLLTRIIKVSGGLVMLRCLKICFLWPDAQNTPHTGQTYPLTFEYKTVYI